MSGAKQAVRLAALQVAGRLLARRASDDVHRPQPRDGPYGALRRPRVLLIRPDHLGDVLLASPAAATLRTALPNADIDWLVGPWTAEMARRAGGPGEILTLAFPGFTRRPKGSPFAPYRLLFQEAARLRTRRYDAALILRPDHWWGAMLAAVAGIPRRFGYAIPECRPFLTDALPSPTGHTVEANQQLANLAAKAFGGLPATETISPVFPGDLTLQPPLRRGGGWRVRSPRAGRDVSPVGMGGQPRIAIHAGSGAAVKNWPPPRWAAVIRALRETHGAEVVLTGGPGERDLVGQIADLVEPRPQTLAGETSLDELAAQFASCDLVIGGDSGPLHLAAAVGTPTVRLYGPTDIREFGPWPPDGSHIALAAGLPCQPCRDLIAPPCGATELPACLRAITTDAVIAAVNDLLARRAQITGQREAPTSC